MEFLTRDPIDPEPLLAGVLSPERGALISFVGRVRDHHQGRSVSGIEYTAYEPMAEAVCQEVIGEARARWPVAVALRHRLGRLAVGEAAVAVLAAGAHRDEAFAACRYVIEEVKRRVPIWKRERYADGAEEWVEPPAEVRGAGPEVRGGFR